LGKWPEDVALCFKRVKREKENRKNVMREMFAGGCLQIDFYSIHIFYVVRIYVE
jgi:hypothetical protein